MSATISRRRLAVEALVTRLGFITKANDYSTDAGALIFVGESPKLGKDDPRSALAVFVRDDGPIPGESAITEAASCRYRLPIEIHGITSPETGVSPGVAYEGLICDIKEAVEIEGREAGKPSATVDRSLGPLGTTLPTGLSRGSSRVQYREGGSEILGCVVEYFVDFEELLGAAVSVRVSVGLGELEQQLLAIGAAGPRVLARALDRAATSGKTAMARAISADIGIATKNVARQIRIDKAGLKSKTDPRIVLSISGREIPLIAFGARGPEPSRGRGRGVTTKLPSKRRLPHAFIATMPHSGHRGVYQREGRGRLPIKQEFGPAMPDVFEKFIAPVFQPAAQESLVKNVIHELEFELSKTGGA